MSQAAGEIYFIGEKDLRTKELTQYFKVGIVRENSNNESRDSTDRLSEHQTGNPRELYIESVVQTELVESVETLLHKQFAPLGVRGEWMLLNSDELSQVKEAAKVLAGEASQIMADLVKSEELSIAVSDDSVLPATEELLALHQSYLQSSAKLKTCNEMLDEIKDIFAAAIGGDEEVEVFAKIQERKGRAIFDAEAFKAKYLEIYTKFLDKKREVKGPATFSGVRGYKPDFKEFDANFSAVVDSFRPLVEKIESGKEKKEVLHGLSLEIRSSESEALWNKLKAESKIKVACGTHAGIEGVLKWARTEKVTEVLNKKGLKEAHPDLVAEFTTQGEATKAVIVDPKKGY